MKYLAVRIEVPKGTNTSKAQISPVAGHVVEVLRSEDKGVYWELEVLMELE